MKTPNEIKSIIQNNRDNIAFVIGNGIHYQYQDCDIPWKTLLNCLWTDFVGTQIKIEEGVSLTELYDIIEMNLYGRHKSTRFNGARLQDLGNLNKKDLARIMFSIGRKTNNQPIDKDVLGSLGEKNQKLIYNSRIWCENNIDNAQRLSDFECVNRVVDALSDGIKSQVLKDEIKRNVAEKFPPKSHYNLGKCIINIKKLNVPILTTNFDTYISESVGAVSHILHPIYNQYKFTSHYPWNMYYSDNRIVNPLNEFAVWHINGTTRYHNSIKLGLSDYMGCVERARKMIQGDDLNEYFTGKNQANWVGYNTWLHIIFNKPLFIFGLALEENEVFLRWLLIQRAKYSKMYNKPLGGWYVGSKINAGKRFFLEQLGFEVIDIPHYNILYTAIQNIDNK